MTRTSRTANDVLAGLFADIGRRGEHLTHRAAHSARLDLRYKGQDHWLSIEVPLGDDRIAASAAEVADAFVADYLRTFGGKLDEAIEIVSVRATARVHLPPRKPFTVSHTGGGGNGATFDAWSFREGKRLPFRVVPRSAIDAPLAGPAIVTEIDRHVLSRRGVDGSARRQGRAQRRAGGRGYEGVRSTPGAGGRNFWCGQLCRNRQEGNATHLRSFPRARESSSDTSAFASKSWRCTACGHFAPCTTVPSAPTCRPRIELDSLARARE